MDKPWRKYIQTLEEAWTNLDQKQTNHPAFKYEGMSEYENRFRRQNRSFFRIEKQVVRLSNLIACIIASGIIWIGS